MQGFPRGALVVAVALLASCRLVREAFPEDVPSVDEPGAGAESLDAGPPGPGPSWGKHATSIWTQPCPTATPSATLTVTTSKDELDAPTADLISVAQAGGFLSFREALWIASRIGRKEKVTIRFDVAVFPPDGPNVLPLERAEYPDAIQHTCIDGRGSWIVLHGTVTPSDAGAGAVMRMILANSMLVGLTWVDVPLALTISSVTLAACRFGTDGRRRALAPLLVMQGANNQVGPGNVFGTTVTTDESYTVSSHGTIEGNHFGYDPLTQAEFPLKTGVVWRSGPELVVRGNAFATEVGAMQSVHLYSDEAPLPKVSRLVIAQNRAGVSLDDRRISGGGGLGSFVTEAHGQYFVNGNRVRGAKQGIVIGGSVQLRQNSISESMEPVGFTSDAGWAVGPTITGFDPSIGSGVVTGTCCGPVEIFSDPRSGGAEYLGQADCVEGTFHFELTREPTYDHLTATCTAEKRSPLRTQTSAFSAPYRVR